jgi:hypothetical protein
MSFAMTRSHAFRRLLVMFLSGAVIVALAAAPAEAKKKKKKKSADTETSAKADSGDKKEGDKKDDGEGKKTSKKSSRKSEDADTGDKKDDDKKAASKKKARKEFDEDDATAAKPAGKAAPAPAPTAASVPASAPADVPPPPVPPADDAETMISRTAGLGRVKVQHVNEMGSSFRLTKLAYDLNGHSIFPEPGKPDPDLTQKTIPVWEGVLPIGENELKVSALYKGVGGGFFAYLNDMSFPKTDTTKIKVTEGATTTVTVLGQEDTSPFTATEDRPHFDYRSESAPTKTANIR